MAIDQLAYDVVYDGKRSEDQEEDVMNVQIIDDGYNQQEKRRDIEVASRMGNMSIGSMGSSFKKQLTVNDIYSMSMRSQS